MQRISIERNLFKFILYALFIQSLIICNFCFEKINAPKYYLFVIATLLAFNIWVFLSSRVDVLDFDIALFLLLFAFSFSGLVAKDKIWFSQHFFSLAILILLYLVTSRTYDSEMILFVERVFICIGIMQVIILIFQVTYVSLPGFQKFPKGKTIIDLLIWNVIEGIRPSGTFGHPNYLSSILVISIVSALYYFKEEKGIFLFASLFVLSTGLALTQSRGGFLELILCVGFWYYLENRKEHRVTFTKRTNILIPSAIVSGVIYGYFLTKLLIKTGGLFERLTHSGSELGTMGRLWFWLVGIKMLISNPLFGVGLGNVKTHAWIYTEKLLDIPQFYKNFVNYLRPQGIAWLHNEYIHFTAETGIIGLVGMIILVWMICNKLLKIFKTKDSHDLALLPIFLVFAVDSLFSMTFHYPVTLFAFGILAGMLAKIGGERVSVRSESSKILLFAYRIIAVFLLFVSLSLGYSGYYLSIAKKMVSKVSNQENLKTFILKSFKNPVIGRLTYETFEPYHYAAAIKSGDFETINNALFIELLLFYYKPEPLRAFKIYKLYKTAGDDEQAKKWYEVLKKMYPENDNRIIKDFQPWSF